MGALTLRGFSREDLRQLAQFFADLANLEVDRWAITNLDEVDRPVRSKARVSAPRPAGDVAHPESRTTIGSRSVAQADLSDLGLIGYVPPLSFRSAEEDYREAIRRHRDENPELHGRPWESFRKVLGLVRALPPEGRGKHWVGVAAVRRSVEDDEEMPGELVVRLLDGQGVIVEVPHALLLNEHHEVEHLFPPDPAERLRALLLLLMSEPTFPFARCTHCRTIFVRDRRSQKFCARTCLVAARLEDPEEQQKRRDYMRRYMKMKRAKKRRER